MAFAMIIIIVGFLMLLDKMGVISSEVWSFFWPLLIIYIGLSMMFSRMNNKHFFGECWPGHNHNNKKTSSPHRAKK